ncbi:MAG: ABC transporter ATP-binding protein [Deltaproteobacteria bacterium]|nr:ABC transporter ATP-binding protein [Deltaproteobacteria bacterium]MDZ4225186.1 ABC transporter ATP-binding protein [bacterium]
MLVIHDLHKNYPEGDQTVSVLKGLSFEVRSPARIGIVGTSGAGKSTLLHIIGGLDQPTSGKIMLDGEDWQALPENRRCRLRNLQIGFIFQFYHLLPELTALENAMLPALIAGLPPAEAKQRAANGLKQVGLVSRENHMPSQLSGGEQQRVAIARACVMRPKFLLADEPTGNLDETTGKEVFQVLDQAAKESGGVLLMVTHNRELAKKMDAVFELKDGKLHAV